MMIKNSLHPLGTPQRIYPVDSLNFTKEVKIYQKMAVLYIYELVNKSTKNTNMLGEHYC